MVSTPLVPDPVAALVAVPVEALVAASEVAFVMGVVLVNRVGEPPFLPSGGPP